MRELAEIKQEMQELCYSGDTEAAHGDADKLLCELVKLLASKLGAETKQEIDAIIDTYDEVDKWYA